MKIFRRSFNLTITRNIHNPKKADIAHTTKYYGQLTLVPYNGQKGENDQFKRRVCSISFTIKTHAVSTKLDSNSSYT